MQTKAAFLLLLLAVTAAAGADTVCPCVPTSYEWIVTPCETWECAASQLVLAGGDPFVISAPTNATKYPWIVVRRVVAGAVVVPSDSPFQLEKFDRVDAASTRYGTVDSSQLPMMMTTADGSSLVIYLRNMQTQARAGGR